MRNVRALKSNERKSDRNSQQRKLFASFQREISINFFCACHWNLLPRIILWKFRSTFITKIAPNNFLAKMTSCKSETFRASSERKVEDERVAVCVQNHQITISTNETKSERHAFIPHPQYWTLPWKIWGIRALGNHIGSELELIIRVQWILQISSSAVPSWFV